MARHARPRKRRARYPQLSSRIGGVHGFKPQNDDGMRFRFSKRRDPFDLNFDPDTFPHVEALSLIIRITRGNFRLIARLCAQIHRVMDVNAVTDISSNAVEAAREGRVIGPTD